jgi:4Fe-4S binding protein
MSNMDRQTPASQEVVQNDQAVTPAPAKAVKAKKKLVRRADRDYSQLVRRSYQAAFLLLNVWVGAVFYYWMRGLETGTAATVADPPAGVEGRLPIAGLMNLKYFVLTGHVPAIHPAAMFLLITFLAMSVLLRKAFCSWLCPIGTIAEYLGLLREKLFGRNFRIWRWLDIPLRGLKYLLLGFFVWAISSMSATAIASFMQSDYGVVAGVKMLNFFRFLGETGVDRARYPGAGFGVCAELLVPLPVPLRCAARICFAAESAAHPARARAVHRLREVCQSLPIESAGGPTHHHQVRRMHGLPGVCGDLPGGRRVASGAAKDFEDFFFQTSEGNSCVGHGSWRCGFVFWNCGLCESRRPVGFTHSRRSVSAACAARERDAPPHVG